MVILTVILLSIAILFSGYVSVVLFRAKDYGISLALSFMSLSALGFLVLYLKVVY